MKNGTNWDTPPDWKLPQVGQIFTDDTDRKQNL